MDQNGIDKAAGLIAASHRGGQRLRRLPPDCSPANASEAHAIQDALTEKLRERVVGWKVGPPQDDGVMRGAIHASRFFESPAVIPASRMPLLGVEAEIAFRFDRELKPRSREYDREEIAASVTAFAAIEVVDTRFLSYRDAPFLDRAADLMSNGGLVAGTARPDWRSFDLGAATVVLTIGVKEIVRQVGGHASGDPILPAVALVNDMIRTRPVHAGAIMTTGTFTGLQFAKPGDAVRAEFIDFGIAEVTFCA